MSSPRRLGDSVFGSRALPKHPHVREVRLPFVKLFPEPDTTRTIENILYLGHRVDVLEEDPANLDFLRVHSHVDGYEGYAAKSAFARIAHRTHRICTPLAYVRSGLPTQAHTIAELRMNSLVRVVRKANKSVCLDGLGWVVEANVTPIGRYERDFVEVIERFRWTPYDWAGIDCSGVLQIGLLASGVPALRNSFEQRETLGEPIILNASLINLHRGDLVFWDKHVAVMVDDHRLIHATDNVGYVTEEPLRDVITRFRCEEQKEILAVRRFPWYRKMELGLR